MKTHLRILAAALAGVSSSLAQPLGPGWHDVPAPAPPVVPVGSPPPESPTPPPAPPPNPPASEALASSPEIVELARGLLNDPVRIYNFVRNNIDYVPYAGSLKGATLTLLDRAGNDVDQSSLLIALLRESGFTANYKLGTMDIPASDPGGFDGPTWLGVDVEKVGQVFANGGNDVITFVDQFSNPVFFRLKRVWVELTIGGTSYLLDPSFTPYAETPGIDLNASLGYDRAQLLGAAAGTTTADYVQNLDGPALESKLAEYAGNLVADIRANYANATVAEIIGGRRIVPAEVPALPTTSPYNPVVEATWTDVPSNRVASVRLQLGSIDLTLPIDGLAGRRLSLTFDATSKLATIWLDDTAVAQEAGSVAGQTSVPLTLLVDHPFEVDGAGGFADQGESKSYQRDGSYAIIYAFGGARSGGHLQKRQKRLDNYRAEGLSDTSREVLTEGLNVMGLEWMKQTSLGAEVMDQLAEVFSIQHHRFGRFGQEEGYYVDVGTQFQSSTGKRAGSSADFTTFRAGSFFASAMEHAVIEQLQDNESASTVKMFNIANAAGDKIYYVNSANFNTVWSQVRSNGGANPDGYPDGLEAQFQSIVNTTPVGVLILPEKYTSTVGGWTGTGYVTYQEFPGGGRSQGMIISGGYFGGFAGDPGLLYPPGLADNYLSDPFFFGGEPPGYFNPYSNDPIDLATGAFYVQTTDLACGQGEPRGLAFTRFYTSAKNNQSGVLGPGWTHNYEGKAVVRTSVDAALGGTTPVDMSSFVAGMHVGLDLMTNPGNAKDWVVGALATGWGVDLLNDNAVAITIGRKTMQFLKLADGSYNDPIGLRVQLTENAGQFELEDRLNGSIGFDTSGRLQAIRDVDGNQLTIDYDGTTSRLTTVTDHYGRTLDFAYDAGHRLQSVLETAGGQARSVSFHYDANGDLDYVEDPELHRWQYAYDGLHRMVSLTDATMEILAVNEYDSLGRVHRQHNRGFDGSSPQSSPHRTWRYYYTCVSAIEEDPLGNQATYFFDSKGRQVARMDPVGNKTFREYDGQNHITRTIDAKGNETTFQFETAHQIGPAGAPGANHNLRFSTYTVDGRTVTVERIYDSENRLHCQFDAAGNKTELTYYPNHLLHREIAPAPLSFVTEYSYYTSGPHLGLPASETDASGNTSFFTYDAFGNMDLVTRPGGLVSDHDYSARGDLQMRTDAAGRVVTHGYDERRLRTLTVFDPSGLALTESRSFDANGDLESFVNSTGERTDYEHDPFGKMLRVIYPNAGTVSYGYDRAERHVTTTGPRGRVTRYQYDSAGRVSGATSAANDSVSFEFDANNNVQAVTNQRGETTAYAHNELDLPASMQTPMNHQTMRDYDDRGFVQRITEPSLQQTTYTYDEAGRLSRTTDPAGTVDYDYEYGIVYDGAKSGFRRSVTEGGQTLSYQYDETGRLQSYADGAGNTITYEYYANDLLKRIIYPGGTRAVTYGYDPANRLTTVTDWDGRITSYAYYPAGHPNQHRLQSVTLPNGTNRVHTYNSSGQLDGTRHETSSGALISHCRFVFDVDGNLVGESIDPFPGFAPPDPCTLTYDADNRATSLNGQALAYDADGNMTQGVLSSGPASLAYDARNRLTSAAGRTFAYDAADRRVSVTAGGTTTTYVHNPNAPLSQLLQRTVQDGAGSATTYYVYGAGGLLYEVSESADAIYYHFDFRGSTVALTDQAEVVTGRVDYDPYGGISQTSGSVDTPFLYNGQHGVLTDDTGLLFMRARYYSPLLRRFINPDPIESAGGLNWYAYANGNPVSFLDPFGLFGWDDVVSIGVGFIPGVGTVQSAVELISGTDHITGDPANRWLAAAGLVAGLVPGGKGALKGGTKVFGAGAKNADEAVDIGKVVAREGDGVIYRRIDPTTGERYVGQAKSDARFTARQGEHNRAGGVQYQFDDIGNARPGVDLDVLEESFIRSEGGLDVLQNARHQMNPTRFTDETNRLLREMQRGMLRDNGLYNGAFGAAENFFRK